MTLDTTMSRLRTSMLTLPLAVIAALVIVVINETAYRHATDDLVEVRRQGQARLEVQSLVRSLTDAETGKRGYLLTGRPDYLTPYNHAVAEIEDVVQRLSTYYADDAEARALFDALIEACRERLSELATTLSLYREGKNETWRELMLTDIGKEQMAAVRSLAAKLLARHVNQTHEKLTDVSETLRISRMGMNAMAVISVLGLLMFLRQTAHVDALQRRHAQDMLAERDRLEREVVRRTEDLTELAKHLQSAREDERSRLARELHDELGALLPAAKLDSARLKRSLGKMAPDAEERLKHLNATVDSGIALKRRIIEDLHPSSLRNLGLVPALEIQAREFTQRSEVPVKTELEAVPLSANAQLIVYRVVQESLTNIAKYAKARNVTVSLGRDGDRVRASVRDDGRGFDPGTTRGSGHGLLGMRYRVESEGGELRVTSRPGLGTLIEAWLPVIDATQDAPSDAAAAVPSAVDRLSGERSAPDGRLPTTGLATSAAPAAARGASPG